MCLLLVWIAILTRPKYSHHGRTHIDDDLEKGQRMEIDDPHGSYSRIVRSSLFNHSLSCSTLPSFIDSISETMG